jgi:hypothetical protein
MDQPPDVSNLTMPYLVVQTFLRALIDGDDETAVAQLSTAYGSPEPAGFTTAYCEARSLTVTELRMLGPFNHVEVLAPGRVRFRLVNRLAYPGAIPEGTDLVAWAVEVVDEAGWRIDKPTELEGAMMRFEVKHMPRQEGRA